ncbi:hypothetical protein R6242_09620 [Iodobacter sp. CM08]|uniref:hypothetical protein n=1 Tax=Iodobacter sp. CM08 TaxID=3085902 RepID=UPI0029812A2A|nr:hypothetical protein [Iodobacter sp. CM08]MDW5416822.1 hypothetical protein [Iodobacter sp. CM08]
MSKLPENKLYICLPGEDAKGVLAGCDNRIILRKHRDVIFDINLKKGNRYTLRAEKSNFYDEKRKKLVEIKKKQFSQFDDGERFYIRVSREFKGNLILELNGKAIGKYQPNALDDKQYDGDPKIKPEPMMVVIGQQSRSSLECKMGDLNSFYDQSVQPGNQDFYQKYLADQKLKPSQFDYIKYVEQKPKFEERAVVGLIAESDLKPTALSDLQRTGSISGDPAQLLKEPRDNSQLGVVVANLANEANSALTGSVMTANAFKETAGYAQSNWRIFNTLGMKLYVEKANKGMYRYVLKGRLLTFTGVAATKTTIKAPIGNAKFEHLGSGYQYRGRGGLGSMKRIYIITKANFGGGMKIGAIGTVIDIFGDANEVFLKDGSSHDFSEFLGRAGVSVLKAGATAAIGGAFAAIISMGAATLGAPVIMVVALVIVGYIIAAEIVDYIDNSTGAKESAAAWAR